MTHGGSVIMAHGNVMATHVRLWHCHGVPGRFVAMPCRVMESCGNDMV